MDRNFPHQSIRILADDIISDRPEPLPRFHIAVIETVVAGLAEQSPYHRAVELNVVLRESSEQLFAGASTECAGAICAYAPLTYAAHQFFKQRLAFSDVGNRLLDGPKKMIHCHHFGSKHPVARRK